MSKIASGNTIAEVAALIGDTARANILSALMGGQALTAGELAGHAGVSAQTTSGHLAKLADAQLLALEKQGRHRYYRLASPEIAHAMEALMAVAATGPKRHRPVGPRDGAGIVTDSGRKFFCDFGIDLQKDAASKRSFCRTCLDWSERRPHLAGQVGAALMNRSLDLGWVARLPESRALRVTIAGQRGFAAAFEIQSDW